MKLIGRLAMDFNGNKFGPLVGGVGNSRVVTFGLISLKWRLQICESHVFAEYLTLASLYKVQCAGMTMLQFTAARDRVHIEMGWRRV